MEAQKFYFHALPLQAYQALDFEIYIKNKKGQYLWGNDFFLKSAAGCSSVDDIYLKSDDLFTWKDYADELSSHDNSLFQSEAALTVREQVIRHNGRYIHIVSNKFPLFNEKQTLIGLLGFSMEIPQVAQKPTPFTKQEYRCISLLSAGYSDKEIGKKLQISPRTVEFHIKNAKQKCHVKSRTQLVANYIENYKKNKF